MIDAVQLPLFPLDRTCRSCGATKPLTDFKPDRESRLGFTRQCRACVVADDKARRARDLPAYRATVNARRLVEPAIRDRERTYEDGRRDQRNALRRARRKANGDAEAEKKRAYNDANREKVNAQARERYRRRPQAYVAASRRWCLTHRAQVAARMRAWRRGHPEQRSAYDRIYVQRHPDVIKARNQRRRVLKSGLGASFTARDWRALCDYYGHRCLCCGAHVVRLCADHVVPLARGGSSDISNIQPLCRHCNAVKYTQATDYRAPPVEEFLAFLETYPYLRKRHRKQSD